MSLISQVLKVKLMKLMDAIVGKLVTNLLNAPAPAPANIKVRSILIIRPGGIGDALLLAPSINSIRSNMPDALITILAESRNAGSFALIPAVDKLLCYDSPTDFFMLLCSHYDLIIDTEQWHRMSAVVARLVTSQIKIGFDSNERRRLFNHTVPYAQDDYEAQSFLNLLGPLGITSVFDPKATFLSLPDSLVNGSDSLPEFLNRPYITIFPGASIIERRWDVLKFRLLVSLLAEKGINSIIIGGKEDKYYGDTIISGTTAVNLAGTTSIAATAALIAKSSLLVSGDSGILHLGVGLGIPTVSLFGAGIAKKWAPKGAIHKVINRNLPCSPCTLFGNTPVCSYRVRCLNEITVSEVYGAIEAVHF